MKCPTPSCHGRLTCRSTRESDRPGRTVRYRKCPLCGFSTPTIETLARITAIPRQPQRQVTTL